MPRAKTVSRDEIFRVALALIDRDGLESISIRRIADGLGVGAMTLYWHVANKTQILDGLARMMLGEFGATAAGDTWIDVIGASAHRLRKMLLAHPNAVPLLATRPLVTTESLDRIGPLVARLHADGFAPQETLWVVQVVAAFVIGHSIARNSPPVMVRRKTGDGFESLDTRNFPRIAEAARIMNQRASEREFQYGLDAMLNGIALRRRDRARRRSSRGSGGKRVRRDESP